MIEALVALVAGAALVSAAYYWRVRWRRAHPLPLPPGVAYEKVGDPVSPAWRVRGSPGRGVRASLISSIRDPLNPDDRAEVRERELADDLRGYLGDVGAQHGADDAMIWMRNAEGAPFVPMAWNHPGAPSSEPWGTTQQRALVAWAAEEGVVSFDGGEGANGAPTLAAARVSLESMASLGSAVRMAGALVLCSAAGIRSSRGDLKLWLPRHAERLAQLVELQVTRNEVARQNRRMRALVRMAQEFDTAGKLEALEWHVAECMLEASGATFAALVAWHAELRLGTVRHATTHYPLPQPRTGDPVEPGSLVGSVCLDGTPRLWQNVNAVPAADALFSPGALVPPSGTLAILPIRRGTRVIGAIVIGAGDPGALHQGELRTAGFFALLAGSALEAAWEMEEVSRTARIDQLTGLWNRRHFDDELKRALDQTDRFGGFCALVIADVDHFKNVNDTHGHQAGDKVLKSIAQIMRELVRTTDVCARIGGEEFCVILPQTEQRGALELAERLRTSVEASVARFQDRDIKVTVSLGVATYRAGGGALKRAQLFESADRALYQAKGEGRNCVRTA
ncbi:MAG TPA: sensor domain-containing diguanylate cyclase [Gemmatimonadaceae bacterium]